MQRIYRILRILRILRMFPTVGSTHLADRDHHAVGAAPPHFRARGFRAVSNQVDALVRRPIADEIPVLRHLLLPPLPMRSSLALSVPADDASYRGSLRYPLRPTQLGLISRVSKLKRFLYSAGCGARTIWADSPRFDCTTVSP